MVWRELVLLNEVLDVARRLVVLEQNLQLLFEHCVVRGSFISVDSVDDFILEQRRSLVFVVGPNDANDGLWRGYQHLGLRQVVLEIELGLFEAECN